MKGKLIKSCVLEDEKKSFIQRIQYKDWYITLTKPFYIVKNFFLRVRRVLNYIPIVWNTYDWDYHSAIDVFKYQLERIADHLDSDDAVTVDAKYNAQRIRTTIRLMDRVFDDYYAMEYMDTLNEMYGRSSFEFVPIKVGDEFTERYEVKQVWESGVTHEEIEEFHTKLFKASQEKQKKAERILWKLLHENIRTWGD